MAEVTADTVREELGNPSDDIISDVTLENIIDDEETLLASAARAASIIARHFALEADKSIGRTSIDYQERAKRWKDLSDELKEAAMTLQGEPIVPGISETAKERQEADGDRVKPSFNHGQFEIDSGDNYEF